MLRAILNNGAEYPVVWCGRNNPARLYIDVSGTSDVEALTAAFSDPEATARITFDYVIAQDTFEGYTRFISAQPGKWTPNTTLITLAKEENNNV